MLMVDEFANFLRDGPHKSNLPDFDIFGKYHRYAFGELLIAAIIGAAVTVGTTIYSSASSSQAKHEEIQAGGEAAAAAKAAAAKAERLRMQRSGILAMQKQTSTGGTLLTSGNEYVPASTVGGALRSTLGGA